ncbi:MAG: HAD family hydrolase [Spirochaetaceae bacterium]|nr:HAD family hydrolase [Spirochaetaceae bacterium]
MKIYRIPAETKAILFDIDSTLYTNAFYAHEQVDVQLRHFAKLKGLAYEEAKAKIDAYRQNWAKEHGGAKTSFGNTLTAFGISIEESVRWREKLIDPAEYLEYDAKLVETMEKLAQKYKIAAVTNNPMIPAKKTLEVLGVISFFDEIIALDTCFVSKPHKLPYKRAAQNLGLGFEQCLSVGDRYDIDLAVPLEMGMGGILVTGVKDVYTLPEILR